MAMKKCSICGKSVGFLDRFDLKDGHICDDCYNSAKAINDDINSFNIFKCSVNTIRLILNCEAVVENSGAVKSTDSHTEESADLALEKDLKENPYAKAVEAGEKATSALYKVAGVIAVIVFIIVAFQFCTDESAVEDAISNITPSEMYIQMVKELEPIDNGVSYEEGFEWAFDRGEWEYFKTYEDKQVVQYTGYIEDANETTVIQFILTPNGSGEYYIEPYAMSINNVPISEGLLELSLWQMLNKAVSQ